MSTVSARIDDSIKTEAERIAGEIGIPLSTAINIFIKKFIAEKGFPFDVTVPYKSDPHDVIDEKLLDTAVKKAVSAADSAGAVRQFTYLDPETKRPVTVIK